jgi:hypothetical protein
VYHGESNVWAAPIILADIAANVLAAPDRRVMHDEFVI